MAARRLTRLRDKHRAHFKRTKPDCYVCGEPIDYDAHHLHPLSLNVDHIIPVSRGGTLTAENVAATHRKCNLSKGAKLEHELQGIIFETTRTLGARR